MTLEDVIEEMIGEEIVDETVSRMHNECAPAVADVFVSLQDLYVDLNNKIKVVRGPSKRVATGKALAPLIAGVSDAALRETHNPC